MSDLDKQYKSNNSELHDECLKLIDVKSVATSKEKATSIETRRAIEDLKERARFEDECMLYL